MKRNSQQGMALIITLIMLSVITFMAITFLVLSRQAADQLNTTLDQERARQGADAGFQQAMSRIMAGMIANTNGFNFDLVVSTNYVSPFYDVNSGLHNITNVNYFDVNGAPLSQKLQVFMLNNLLIQPRAPVFITTNKNPAFPPEFRFYLDLNRNGLYDPTGFGLDQFGNFVPGGDPQWIGILEHPDQPHSPSNQFIARVAFFAVPIGNGLDFNYIHNMSKQKGPALDGFLRNEGVGSWEINLAGFLNGLDPNIWTYVNYDTRTEFTDNLTFSSTGSAFSDAAAILNYRYNGNYATTLASFQGLYRVPAGRIFNRDGIDGYSVGPLMTNLSLPQGDGDVVTSPWSGADNTNHLFTTSDLFGASPTLATFTNNLYAAGATFNGTSNYTYYRMLAQMGMDSAPEQNKLNLNYVNIGGTNVTNFIQWTPVQFFSNAADRLLKSQPDLIYTTNNGLTWNNLSITNIPIYPTNYYTPAVHRMLQLAANIYDAGTNKAVDFTASPPAANAAPLNFDYPSVFRPTFGVTVIGGITNVIINGYQEVPAQFNVTVGDNRTALSQSLSLSEYLAGARPAGGANIYGVPWVIGARPGLPNFNKFSLQNFSQMQRKVQVDKVSATTPPTGWKTNVQYVIGISNMLGVEAWNSYMTAFPRNVDINVYYDYTMVLTNSERVGQLSILSNNVTSNLFVPAGTWAGFTTNYFNPGLVAQSFRVPLLQTNYLLNNLVYHRTTTPAFNLDTTFDPNTTALTQPQFGLNLTNRMRLVMRDRDTGRILDYVQFDGIGAHRDLTQELVNTNSANNQYADGGVWDTRTNRSGLYINGIANQIAISLGVTNFTPFYGNIGDTDWQNANYQQAGYGSRQAAVQGFTTFFASPFNPAQPKLQVPFTPTRNVSVFFTWQANDPLVHYTLGDLKGLLGPIANLTLPKYDDESTNQLFPAASAGLYRVSPRYLPWGGTGNLQYNSPDYAPYINNLALKDPLVSRSDFWQFPTNKYPNIGWLGRVHRGTPWQTVYLKSAQVDSNQWRNWTGNSNFGYFAVTISNVFGVADSQIAQPTGDWAILDLFTTAPNDNASRGQLSVNQPNFASWAAIFDGVNVVSNTPAGFTNFFIDPNTNALALNFIWTGINKQRNRLPGRVFTRLGDILATPELTVNSPFLNAAAGNVSDAEYERLPQQVLSLLHVGSPRYVIYAYGQALKPAPNSRFTGSTFGAQYYNTVTNYQITAEMVTRTVVRFEPNGPVPATTNIFDRLSQIRFNALNPTQNPLMPQEPLSFQRPIRAVVESFVVLPPE